MSRLKKEVVFEIGDKVKLTSSSIKTEGVVVHRHSVSLDGREWSVHWYNMKPARGVYRSTEIQKYY